MIVVQHYNWGDNMNFSYREWMESKADYERAGFFALLHFIGLVLMIPFVSFVFVKLLSFLFGLNTPVWIIGFIIGTIVTIYLFLIIPFVGPIISGIFFGVATYYIIGIFPVTSTALIITAIIVGLLGLLADFFTGSI